MRTPFAAAARVGLWALDGLPPTADQGAWPHDEVQAAGDVVLFGAVRDAAEVGNDPADMVALDRNALVLIRPEGRRRQPLRPELALVDGCIEFRPPQVEVQPQEALAEGPEIREADGRIDDVTAAVRVDAHRPEQAGWQVRVVPGPVLRRRRCHPRPDL